MNKYLLTVLCTFIALFTNAQEPAKYLAGAVPTVDGKVVFSKSISVKKQMSDSDIFNLVEKWAKDNYKETDNDLTNRVLLVNPEEKSIACMGEKYLVFRKSAFILDRTKLMYQLILKVNSGVCNATVRNIKYEYSDSDSYYLAEEMITDEVALNKNGKKLNRYYDKFRRYSVDSINAIFNSLDSYLNGGVSGSNMPMQESVIAPMPTAGNVMAAYKKTEMLKIPQSLKNKWGLVVSATGNQMSVNTALWDGFGTFMDKNVGFFIFNPKNFSVENLEQGETYTLLFFTDIYQDAIKSFSNTSGKVEDKLKEAGFTPIKTPSGATAFSEAWMIIECKKGGALPDTKSAEDNSSSDGISRDGYNKVYMGEILNVWVK